MEPFKKVKTIITPLDKVNVDTDQIVPKQFLKLVQKSGFGKFLFYNWRYDENEKEKQDFILNNPKYQGSNILVAGDNFGCGSSREHAPWALLDYGIKVVISTSFADIFYNNCFKNGMLPIVLDEKEVSLLMEETERGSNATLTVDLESQEITTSDCNVINFKIDKFLKHCLLNGLDDIALTLEKDTEIKSFEDDVKSQRPWL